jgi:hypothetical protein
MSAKKENAYLTLYLSLIFGIVLSLLLALIEGAAIGAVRVQTEIVADLGMDSVFAEYNRELLSQYELFFIDSSYGGINGGTGMVETHLSDYMGYNMTPDKDKSFPMENMLLTLKNPYLEITNASFATDDECMVWKSQAVNYMKSVYGGDLVKAVKANLDKVSSNLLDTRDVASEVSEQKKAFEEALADNDIVEYGAESDEGYSYQKVSGMFDRLVGGGLLMLVMPRDKEVSGAVMDSGAYFTSRLKSGNINKGTGLHEGADKPSGMVDELIYGEYLMNMCGTFTNPKDESLLKYQIEYILYGKNSDSGNLRSCVERLYALRAAADIITIYSDSAKKAEVNAVSVIICTLLGIPKLAKTLANIILGVWALAEAASDVNILLNGGKVELIKSSDKWNVSLKGLFSGSLFGDGKSTSGLSYNDYLRIFMGLMDKNAKVQRSLDVVEMDLRKTVGNENFRIDRCIDYLKVSFGFEDSNGHDFVFSKTMCYE